MTITHSQGEYSIEFNTLAIALASLDENTVIVSDDNVLANWRQAIPETIPVVSVPPGENSKSVEVYAQLLGKLLQHGVNRQTTIVAFGGGVIGDLAGFAAATLLRGLPLVQIPSSLLAMVDSSVGGKVGINFPEGKNLVGSFKPPACVWICPELLTTLPEREFRCGIAEVIKAGLVADLNLISELEQKPLDGTDDRLADLIRQSILVKCKIVQDDEFETTGRRAVLNFGHTVGHAIEQATGYGPIKHGEAVAIGMVLESEIGEVLMVTEIGTSHRVRALVKSHGLPTRMPSGISRQDLVKAMRSDKKSVGDGLAFSFLMRPGECKLVTNVLENEITDFFDLP